MHGCIVVVMVMSSIYALMGGKHRPFLDSSPPTTDQDAWMMSSIAMMSAVGEMVQPAMMLPGAIPCPKMRLLILKNIQREFQKSYIFI